jgi:HSP20 family protein
MQRDIESLFSNVEKRRNRFPSINIYDNSDAITAQFIIPGMRKEDIDITFENGALFVKGERKEPVTDDKYSLVREERNIGTFSRTVEIPTDIDVKNINASMENGILSITMPKAEEAKPKRISIN